MTEARSGPSWHQRLLLALTIALLATMGLVVFTYVQAQHAINVAAAGVRTAQHAATVAKGNADQAAGLAQAVQNQRLNNIRETCQASNSRHDNTLRALSSILARAERTALKGRRAQIEASRASTVLLINALAPKQDCARVVALATRSK